MRYLLPAAASAAIVLGVSTAGAQSPDRIQPHRAPSHVALHLSQHDLLSGRSLRIEGRVHPAGRHRVKLIIRGPRTTTLTIATKPSGNFVRRWEPERIGPYELRAYDLHDRRSRSSVSPLRRITAFHRTAASYYGPGLYGAALACGGILRPNTLGVASKSLPCGTKVSLRYRERSITVSVIDRGPYVAGREFDLTAATKARLDFPGLGDLLSSR
jgi:rare lipoprotein A